jgi:iron-sulfur cluster repair protein YtfE (RIC family)
VNDPIAMLKKDHREVEDMLGKLQDSKPGPRRRGTVDRLEKSLALHMQIEEQLVYPLVEREVGHEAAEEAMIEHKLAREGLQQLRELVDKPGFAAAVDMVKAGIKHHVKDEEQEVFPQLKREIDRETLRALGDRVAVMKGGRPTARRAAKTPARKTAKRSAGKRAGRARKVAKSR